ncbi:hypothetical protein NDAWWUGD_CDS0002 [Salmonella phage SeKF_80]
MKVNRLTRCQINQVIKPCQSIQDKKFILLSFGVLYRLPMN